VVPAAGRVEFGNDLMKAWEMAVVSATYLIGVAATWLVLCLLWRGDPALAFIVAATVGTTAGAWLHGRRTHKVAGLAVKAEVGALLAGLCLAVGLTGQLVWDWLGDPYMSLTICIAGTFVFPIVLFGTMELAFMRRGEKHYRFR